MDKSVKLTNSIYTDGRREREDISSSNDTCDVKLKSNSTIQPTRSRNARRLQNFILVWLDSSIDNKNNINHRSIITELQQVANDVETFTDADECMDFIADFKEHNIFLILSETFVQTIAPVVDEIPQVSSIYIFPVDQLRDEEWTKQWLKIGGVFADISSMCEELKKAIQNCNYNSISISVVKDIETLNRHLDTLDSSFMYTLILKEILLTIDFEQVHFNAFLTYLRELFADGSGTLKIVDEFEKEYYHHTPIWWYTRESFLYAMVNRALRLMDVDVIVQTGFFVRDLHNHIVALHKKQYGRESHSNPFTVYRGQSLMLIDFNQLQSAQGGLLSFNSFLSTSQDRNVALNFAKSSARNSDTIGVLFIINVNPSTAAAPFANTQGSSIFEEEKEILFSMHSIFRIGKVTQIGRNDRSWQVELTLTNDNDSELQALTEYMRRESFSYKTAWHRLGSFLLKVGHFDKAEEVLQFILDRTSSKNEMANIYDMLGIAKFNKGEYIEAITFYEKSIEIMKKILPTTHPKLASLYRNVGTAYEKIGEYSKALSCQEKAFGIYQNVDSSNHSTFSNSSNINDLMNETSDINTMSILSFEKVVEVLETTLPKDDLSLMTYYDHYGSLYEKMGNNLKALSFYHRAFRIKKVHLPSNHPSLAASYANLGAVYEKLVNVSEINWFYQWAFCTEECLICEKIANSSTAHSFHPPFFNVPKNLLLPNNPDLQTNKKIVNHEEQEPLNDSAPADSHKNGHAKSENTHVSSTAHSFHQLAFDIAQRSLPINHPDREKYRKKIENEGQNS